MRKAEAFPSKYFSQEDVWDADVTLTIKGVSVESIRSEHGSEDCPIMVFKEDGYKPWIVNNTNWGTCEDRFGEDSDDWLGKQIRLWRDPEVMYGSIKKGGVRIRPLGYVSTPAPDTSTIQPQTGTSPLGNAPIMWPDAVELAEEAGISKDDLIAKLQAQGIGGDLPKGPYVPSKHSQAVRNIIDFEGKDDKSIPF